MNKANPKPNTSEMDNRHESVYVHLLELFGNEDAARFGYDVFMWTQFYDDLIDKDNEYSEEDIHWSMWRISFTMYDNPFYLANRLEIAPLMRNMVVKWKAANKYEKEKRSLEKAYMLRACVYDLFAHMHMMINGMDADFTQVYDLYAETLDELKEEFKDEQ